MIKKISLCVTVCLLAIFAVMTTLAVNTTAATEQISPDKPSSLTLTYTYGKTKFSGLTVNVFRIADVSSDFQYTYTDAFEECSATLNGVSALTEWGTARTTVSSYITKHQIKPDFTEKTNSDGIVKLDGMTPGMYFVKRVIYGTNSREYTFEATLVSVPSLNDDGTWSYDTSASPKGSYYRGNTPDKPDPIVEKTKYKLVKLWKDSGSEKSRPKSVDVNIYRNGKLYKTVTLSSSNDWAYSWEVEKNSDLWQIAEKNTQKNYTVAIEQHGNSFTVINTYKDTDDPDEPDPDKPEPDEPDNPDDPDKPEPDEPDNPDDPDKPEPDEPDNPDDPDKPEPDEPDNPDDPDKPEPDEPDNSDDPDIPTPDEPFPSEPTPPPSDVPSDSPKTGDTTDFGFYLMLMCISGMILIILGVTAGRKTR